MESRKFPDLIVAASLEQASRARENVAALSERLWQSQIFGCPRRPQQLPDLSLRGPEGPWQSREGSYDSAGSILLSSIVLRDSHVASLLGMTNLGALHVQRECLHICNCPWRSLTAATDAIGLYVFIGSLYELPVPSRDCHGPSGASQ